ncbi:MAG: hypothetical protein QXG57_08475 [Thermofilaceae archaeon]
MTEAQPAEAYPNYILTDDEFRLISEFEVPARVLDLLISFYESSTKPKYIWNEEPYRKVMRDGSFWQVVVRNNVKIQVKDEIKEKDAICVIATSWTSWGEVCAFDDDTVIVRVYYANRSDQMWTDGWETAVVLKSKYRDQTLELFNVYRKLLFYKNLISRAKVEKSEAPAAETAVS